LIKCFIKVSFKLNTEYSFFDTDNTKEIGASCNIFVANVINISYTFWNICAYCRQEVVLSVNFVLSVMMTYISASDCVTVFLSQYFTLFSLFIVAFSVLSLALLFCYSGDFLCCLHYTNRNIYQAASLNICNNSSLILTCLCSLSEVNLIFINT
jgi:hypothetical protein